jgi:O-antigen ligase
MKTALYILLPLIAFAYFPLAFEEFESTKVVILMTFTCFAFDWVSWRPLLKDRIAQALALLVVSAGVSTALSIDWHMSLYGNPKCRAGLFVYFSYLVFYLAAKEVIKTKEVAQKVIDILIFCSLGTSIYAIFQVIGIDYKVWVNTMVTAGYTRPMASLGHPNFMAAYLAMIVPFNLYKIDQIDTTKERNKAIGYYMILLVSIAAIWLALSRGMLIAMCIGVFTYYVTTSIKYKKLFGFTLATTGMIGLCLSISPVFRQTAIDRMHSLFDPGPARIEYPTAAIRIWQKAPLFGIGTDAYEIGFRNQRTPLYWQVERAGSPHKAHNDFLNTLATQGVFGALAALLILISVGFKIVNNKQSPFFASSLAAVVVFYVEGLSSFTIVATGTLFLLAIAMLDIKPDQVQDK